MLIRLPSAALTVPVLGAAALGVKLSQVRYTVVAGWSFTCVVTAVAAPSALYWIVVVVVCVAARTLPAAQSAASVIAIGSRRAQRGGCSIAMPYSLRMKPISSAPLVVPGEPLGTE